MRTVFRICLSIFAGMALAFACVVAVELFSSVVHPVPPEFTGTPEEMSKHVERYPPWVLAVGVVAWSATTFGSTWVATRLGKCIPGFTVGLLLLAALVFNVSMLPYPMWFKIVTPACFLVAIFLGIRTAYHPPNTPVEVKDS